MKNFKLIAFLGFISFFSCFKDCDDSPECIFLCKNENWKTNNLKPGVFIQFPESYEGQGMVGFEGFTFQKQSSDQSVDLHYAYCGPLYCELYGQKLASPKQNTVKTIDQDGSEIILENKIAFCENGQKLAYFYYNKNDNSKGVYYMKTENGYFEALSVDFQKYKLNEVIEILKTITPIYCSPNTICTQIYISIVVKVQDKNGNPANLKKAVIKFENTGRESNVFQSQIGNYAIITDNDILYMQKGGNVVTFIGYGENSIEPIFTEKYIVGHDCCHVVKLEGKDIIVVQ